MLVDGTWQPTFPRARHLMGRTEFEYWRDQRDVAEQVTVFSDSVQPVFDAGLVDLVGVLGHGGGFGPLGRLLRRPSATRAARLRRARRLNSTRLGRLGYRTLMANPEYVERR